MAQEREKVIVAMSGGVDSSVAAALLLRQGYDVTGVFMCLGTAGQPDGVSRGCCSPQDAADARRVAGVLGIDLYVLNLADEFSPIIDYFVREYTLGRTPNPCIRCNSDIKFGRLIRRADSLGIAHVATGHYARITRDQGGPAIARALARQKDQSYALFAVATENLGRILLPLGELPSKEAVRKQARELGLSVHDKPDSQEICFVPDDDHVAFLRGRAPQAFMPGPVVNSEGKVLGRHEGCASYTIGQRRGLRIAGPEPMYVIDIDPATATVTIGSRSQAQRTHLRASGALWHAPVSPEFDATVQIRYSHEGAPGRVKITSAGSFEVEFAQPVMAITPGQGAVVYDGDRLLGGGWIEKD